jgi:hypothetical protein
MDTKQGGFTMSINALGAMGFEVKNTKETMKSSNDLANEVKEIGKARLARKVLEDPSLAKKMPALQASPVYNSRGEIIQSLGM